MIPGNVVTATAVVSSFRAPLNRPYQALEQVVLGGSALNNGSQGREVQNWKATFANNTISVGPENGAVVFTLNANDVKTVSLAFDGNMSVVLGWQTFSNTSKLYYYDSQTSAYVTRVFNSTSSCRVGVDDPRVTTQADSDVIFAYTTGSQLCYRQQRDRYDIEYVIGPTTKRLIKMGLTEGSRLQFELKR